MTDEVRRLLDMQVGQSVVIIVLDGGEELELAPGSVPAGLPTDGSAIGESISSPLLAEIRLAAERKKVARRLFSMLDKRLMPVARIRRKLTDQGYTEAAVEAVLEQMQTQGLYSDRTYAAAYCRDRLAGRPVGRVYLQQKLREKQVPAGVAAEVVAEVLDAETEKELALKAARRKWRTVRGPDERKCEQKVARHLQSRGFPVGLVWDAVRRGKPREDEPSEGEWT